MDYSEVVTLLKVDNVTDESGMEKPQITTRTNVFCKIVSVGMKEVYTAQQIGRNPEIKAIIREFAEYNDEQYAIINSKCYKLIRTYRTGTQVELTLERTNDIAELI